MADLLIQASLSNLIVASILAVIAWLVQARVRSASLANLLWSLVLIKMITPPLFSLPVLEVPSLSSSVAGQERLLSEGEHSMATGPRQSAVPAARHGNGPPPTNPESHQATPRPAIQMVKLALALLLSISVMLLFLSALRVMRFHWLLRANTHSSPDLSQSLAADLAGRFALRQPPNILVTTANIAPFVWWQRGRAVVVVSHQATQQLSAHDLRLVIAHEIAHIKRCDHWFRWLEWAVLIGFWWNPLMWWARQQLRISEEMACDDLVLETTSPDAHQYANSLLNMAELLTPAAIRPPLVASAINSGGHLEKRLKMIIAEKTWKLAGGWRLAIVAMATCLFPLGIVCAQDFDAVERRLGGAVEAGELSLQQATTMLEALKRTAGNRSSDRQAEARKRRYLEYLSALEVAVKEGKISKEDAEKKLIAMRTVMFGDTGVTGTQGDDADREMEVRKLRYQKIMERVNAALERGDLSAEAAEQKLLEIRKEMFGDTEEKKVQDDKSDREMEVRKLRYQKIMERVNAALERGDLSAEEAERKLLEIRQELFGDSDEKGAGDDQSDRDVAARKRRYLEVLSAIEVAVEEGKISKQDAEKKLVALRKEMFGDTDAKEAEDDQNPDCP